MQSGKRSPDGDEDAPFDVAMDELCRTGLSPARSRSLAEAPRPGKSPTARPVAERRKWRVRQPTRMVALRAGTQSRQCRLEHPRYDRLNWGENHVVRFRSTPRR